MVLLLILGAGLFLWRTRVKKSLEPGRGRLHFSSPGPHTSLPWTLGSLPPAFTAQGMSLQEGGGDSNGLGVMEGRVQVSGLRLQLLLCMNRCRVTGGAQGP